MNANQIKIFLNYLVILMILTQHQISKYLHSNPNHTVLMLNQSESVHRLTVTTHLLDVSALPSGVERTTHGLVGSVPLDVETSGLSAGRGKTTSLSVLVNGSYDPVDSRVVTDRGVVGVNTDDLVVFVSGVLVNPVTVKNT